jgi:hypothetical protein
MRSGVILKRKGGVSRPTFFRGRGYRSPFDKLRVTLGYLRAEAVGYCGY